MEQRLIDLCEALREIDEVTLLDLLEIRTSDLIDKFLDEIEDKMSQLEGEIFNDK